MKKALLQFDEVQTILNCSKDHIYDLLRDGKLQAHNPHGKPGTRGTKDPRGIGGELSYGGTD